MKIAQGVVFAESEGYTDAVGDLAQLADPKVSEKWGPSIGLFQIRSLRHPEQYPVANGDRLRVAENLRDAVYNAKAAYVISKQGTDWSKWTTYRNDTYKEMYGKDFPLRTGHPQANLWNV